VRPRFNNGWDIPNNIFDYGRARASAAKSGNVLAHKIQNVIDTCRQSNPDYNPSIQFIGHSLGTMVNAEAVSRLNGIVVDQVDMIDTPWNPINSNKLLDTTNLLDHDPYFFDLLQEGNVRQVQNFYSDSIPFPFGTRFGQPIGGALNTAVPKVTHTNIPSFYADLIRGTQTQVPGLEWDSPALTDWSPSLTWVPKSTDSSVDFQSRIILFDIEPISDTARLVDDLIWRLETQSPSGIVSETLEIPEDISHVSFDITPETTQGVAALYFNDSLLWMSGFFNLGDSDSVFVPIGELAGMSGEFLWEINSFGDTQVALISNIQLTAVTPVLIPEPNSMSLISIALLATIFLNHQSRRRR